jgi:hypothetical protein
MIGATSALTIGGALVGIGLSFGGFWLLVCALTYSAPSGVVSRAPSHGPQADGPSTHWLAGEERPAPTSRTEPDDPPYL